MVNLEETHAVLIDGPIDGPIEAGIAADIEIRVNGEKRSTSARLLSRFLDDLGLSGRPVAVELNRVIVPKEEHPNTLLNAGDALEIIQFVGGG